MRKTVTDAFKEMHEYYDKGYTPRVKTRKGCLKCSLRDICLPQLTKNVSVRTYINRRPPLDNVNAMLSFLYTVLSKRQGDGSPVFLIK